MKSPIRLAKRLRHDQTDAERRLWYRLRDRRLNGWKFRRQVPIDRFVVDFVCHEARLVVELDGGQHSSQAEYDGKRTEILKRCGYRVARYWNHMVFREIDVVLDDILAHLEGRK